MNQVLKPGVQRLPGQDDTGKSQQPGQGRSRHCLTATGQSAADLSCGRRLGL